MSRAPYSMPRGAQFPKAGNLTIYDTSLGWRYPNPKMEALFPLEAMGCTAENIVDRYQISRQAQDEFALASQQKAVKAIAEGAFGGGNRPSRSPAGRKNPNLYPRRGPSTRQQPRKTQRAAGCISTRGSVTTGNSSTLNDGSSAMIVCTKAAAQRYNLKPMAKIIACGSAGVDPTIMGIGPVPASQKALQRAKWTSQTLNSLSSTRLLLHSLWASSKSSPFRKKRVNVHGGAIALGHPLGCSGARILTTLIHALHRHNKSIGLASLCVGVGQGLSLIVEATDGI